MRFTFSIPIHPLFILLGTHIAYAWNELTHWGMSIHAPMYPAFLVKRNALLTQLENLK